MIGVAKGYEQSGNVPSVPGFVSRHQRDPIQAAGGIIGTGGHIGRHNGQIKFPLQISYSRSEDFSLLQSGVIEQRYKKSRPL